MPHMQGVLLVEGKAEKDRARRAPTQTGGSAQGVAGGIDQAGEHALALLLVGRLDHHADERLAPRGADEDPSATLEPGVLAPHGLPHGGRAGKRLTAAYRDVLE